MIDWRAIADGCGKGGVLLLICVLQPALAQEMAFDRKNVLDVAGTSESADLLLHSAEPGPGLIFRQPMTHPTATALRLRFRVATPSHAQWSLVVLANGTERWRIDSVDVGEDEIWSDEIPGNQLEVQLHSGIPNNPIEIVVDRIAASQSPSVPLSITGTNQLAPILAQSDEIKTLGRSVARLKFVSDEGSIHHCTAFLVSQDLLLTNEHCISSESERRSAIVAFDYDEQFALTTSLRLSALIKTSKALDYALVRLERPVARSALVIADAPVAADDELLIIQHPGGEPKQVSILDCRVSAPLVAGMSSAPTDFSHLCDTKGGSSGAPVMSVAHHAVIGLHHLGFRATDATLHNRAVHMDRVAADLPDDLFVDVDVDVDVDVEADEAADADVDEVAEGPIPNP